MGGTKRAHGPPARAASPASTAHSSYALAHGMNGGDQFAQTPADVLALAASVAGGAFDFDPCPANPTFDGLAVPWGVRTFVNPPYQAIAPWLLKARHEAQSSRAVTSVFLIPFRPTTLYFSTMVTTWEEVAAVHILRKHITFRGYAKPAHFISCLVVIAPGPRAASTAAPYFYVYRSVRAQRPAEVAAQLGVSYAALGGATTTDATLHERPEDWPAGGGALFLTVVRDFGKLHWQAKTAAARGTRVEVLIPVRDNSKTLMDVYFAQGHEHAPDWVAFLCPHLLMGDTKDRSPFPSMLVSYGAHMSAAELAAAGCTRFRCDVHFI